MMNCFPLIFSRKSTSSSNEIVDNGFSFIPNVNQYTFKELSLCTEIFSVFNKIGCGGFGSVYKGRLKNGTDVAVKVLSPESKQGIKEFLTEINLISNIEHGNLLKLYGCCVEEDNRILVYEYLENNSVAQAILGGGHNRVHFDWNMRSKIIIDVAQGLACLHEGIRPHIIHRDIKASNILLDKDFTAKISDFGLARLIPDNQTHVSTRIAGTVGYMAPEYAMRGRLTRKADVYSFGILLLEIVSGRCNNNSLLPIQERYLVDRAWKLYDEGKLVELLDMSVRGDAGGEGEGCRYMRIALMCAQEMPKDRPSMGRVARMLLDQSEEVDSYRISKPGILLPEDAVVTSHKGHLHSNRRMECTTATFPPPQFHHHKTSSLLFRQTWESVNFLFCFPFPSSPFR